MSGKGQKDFPKFWGGREWSGGPPGGLGSPPKGLGGVGRPSRTSQKCRETLSKIWVGLGGPSEGLGGPHGGPGGVWSPFHRSGRGQGALPEVR